VVVEEVVGGARMWGGEGCGRCGVWESMQA